MEIFLLFEDKKKTPNGQALYAGRFNVFVEFKRHLHWQRLCYLMQAVCQLSPNAHAPDKWCEYFETLHCFIATHQSSDV
jgi:hypothetical protein